MYAWALTACGTGTGLDRVQSLCESGSGSLVISEILSDPNTHQDSALEPISAAAEWFEVFNATSSPQPLDGLLLRIAGSGAPREYPIASTGLSLEPGGYAVVGGRASEGAPYVDVSQSFRLNDRGGVIELVCGATVVDAVAYGDRGSLDAPEPGISLALDGQQAPGTLPHAGADRWCPAQVSYDGMNLGSPGSANAPCGIRTCEEGGETRPARSPAEGELIFSEVYADAPGADENREWIELFNASDRVVELNGLSVTNSNDAGNQREAELDSSVCLKLEPGAYAVVGSNTDPALNGGLALTAVASGLSLYNSNAVLSLRLGERVIDRAEVPGASSGVSVAAQALTAVDNDHPASFCLSTTPGRFDGLGTPGAINDPCDGDRGGNERDDPTDATCVDQSERRGIKTPLAGEVVVSEVFADPTGADGHKEYLELYVSAPVELNGLTIRVASDTSERAARLGGRGCLSFTTGEYVVLAASDDPTVNGAVHANLALGLSQSFLYNGDLQTITLESPDGQVIDRAVVPDGGPGTAVSAIQNPPTSAGNDSARGWCREATLGLFDEVGSPGVAGTCQ